MPSYIGIDPGVHGAMARIILPGWDTAVVKLPDTPEELADWLKQEKEWIDKVVVERSQPFRRERSGVTPAFRLGVSYGEIRGVLATLDISRIFVPPQVWQKKLGCLSGGDKHVTRNHARAFFPSVKVTLQNADALLLARYAAERYGFPQAASVVS